MEDRVRVIALKKLKETTALVITIMVVLALLATILIFDRETLSLIMKDIFQYLFLPGEILIIIFIIYPKRIELRYKYSRKFVGVKDYFKKGYSRRRIKCILSRNAFFWLTAFNFQISLIIPVTIIFYLNNSIELGDDIVYSRKIEEIGHTTQRGTHYYFKTKSVNRIELFWISKNYSKKIKVGDDISITIHNGLFGYPIIKSIDRK
ncbi:MAG TPA: hypothetical protein PKG60_05830 [Spirochaetota bacterium]|nr:hypothetical protein [Spirochaetota bacterium]